MTDNRWISFHIEKDVYAHSIEAVKEIIPYSAPAPVPGAPDYIEGILNVRGAVVPIVSARLLFELDSPVTNSGAKIIILEKEESLVGVSVDVIGEIFPLSADEAEWEAKKERKTFIKGTLYREAKLYILTDFIELAGSTEKYT